MYAIVDIAGQQFKVEKDQKLFVHRLEGEEGKKVSFEKVLLIDSGSKVSVGDPVVKGASVAAKIVSHVKGDKVLVFKKKRRKGYKVKNGHRQFLTEIQIDSISTKAPAKKKAAQKEEPVESEKPKAKKTTAKKETSVKEAAPKKAAPAKKAAPKSETKAPAKKAAAKKPAAKKSAPAKKENPEK